MDLIEQLSIIKTIGSRNKNFFKFEESEWKRLLSLKRRLAGIEEDMLRALSGGKINVVKKKKIYEIEIRIDKIGYYRKSFIKLLMLEYFRKNDRINTFLRKKKLILE